MQSKYIGSEYGGFPCVTSILTKESIVLDFGVGEDISFAEGLHNEMDCNIELFDFTPDSISWFKDNHSDKKYLTYNEFGISDFDGILQVHNYGGGISRRPAWMGFEPNEEYDVKTIKTILIDKKIKVIDLLKLDIEGEEYTVISNMFDNNIYPKQICLETHERFLKEPSKHYDLFDTLNSNHYNLIQKHGDEYCFIWEKNYVT